MTYASQQNLIDRYGSEALIQLTDRAGAQDAVDATAVGVALAAADSEINSYLAARYTLPLTETSTALRDKAAELSWVILHENVGVITESTDRIGKNVRAWLKLVSEGKAVIGVNESTGEVVASVDSVTLQNGAERVFDRESCW